MTNLVVWSVMEQLPVPLPLDGTGLMLAHTAEAMNLE